MSADVCNHSAPSTYLLNAPTSQTDWNEHSPKIIEENGKNSTPWAVYDASKTLAERAAWAFVEREKPTFDVTAIVPTFNIGPYIHEVISLQYMTR